MGKKYWVPALGRANDVLRKIATRPEYYKMSELASSLKINKSTMFNLLRTMEMLDWIIKERDGTYSLGAGIATLSAAYFNQFNIVHSFYDEAPRSVKLVNEHAQLGILHDKNILYLGKVEGDSRVKLKTEPGDEFPAYATAIGKVQLAQYTHDELKAIFPEEKLAQQTPFTVSHIDSLYDQIKHVDESNYVVEFEEAVLGFCCIASPIINYKNKIIGGVSFTIPKNNWYDKQHLAKQEIKNLAKSISKQAGFLK